MAIPKVAPRAIVLVGKETGRVKELIAGGTITPGMLLAINSANKYVAHNVAAGRAGLIFADMQDYVGKGIDDNYVANDNVFAWQLNAGAEVNALVAAAAAAIVVGDFVESDGAGGVRKATAASQLGSGTFAYTPAGFALGIALTAVDNSGGASPVRIQILTV